MNTKKLLLAMVAVFVTFWICSFVIHGVLLKGLYAETATLWRPEADMGNYMAYMILGQVLSAVFFTWIFVHGYKGTGWMEGVRYGLLVGGFCTGGNLIMHAVAPYPCALTVSWIGACFAQSVLGGVVASLVYKKK